MIIYKYKRSKNCYKIIDLFVLCQKLLHTNAYRLPFHQKKYLHLLEKTIPDIYKKH